jgi:hypothetical protein
MVAGFRGILQPPSHTVTCERQHGFVRGTVPVTGSSRLSGRPALALNQAGSFPAFGSGTATCFQSVILPLRTTKSAAAFTPTAPH